MTEEEAEAALELHVQQRQAAWSKPLKLMTDLVRDHYRDVKRRPGRQYAWQSRNVRTYQSSEAAHFITQELELFRKQNGLTRVHPVVRKRFWEIALERYPEADEDIVWDRIRMMYNKRSPF